MKIKDILTEGPLDFLRKKFGIQKTDPKVEKGLELLRWYQNEIYNSWKKYSNKTGDTDIKSWAEKFFKDTFDIEPLGDSTSEQKEYLSKLLKTHLLDRGSKSKIDVRPQDISGFEVISQEPIVIRYNKKDYALTKDGEWQKVGARGAMAPLVKDTDPSLEKLLDKVAGFGDVKQPIKVKDRSQLPYPMSMKKK